MHQPGAAMAGGPGVLRSNREDAKNVQRNRAHRSPGAVTIMLHSRACDAGPAFVRGGKVHEIVHRPVARLDLPGVAVPVQDGARTATLKPILTAHRPHVVRPDGVDVEESIASRGVGARWARHAGVTHFAPARAIPG